LRLPARASAPAPRQRARYAGRGLTRRWRRRATAYAWWQARVCTVWPAPQLGRWT